jgi:queuine tRNA-ribosyltransferase
VKFGVHGTCGAARCGLLETAHGAVRTPAFMPVGTYGTVKAMTPEEVQGSGADIILGNTFHLMLRPGTRVIEKHGGLHGFMHWPRPILTDSGGFQVWSLAERRKISEDGVSFASPVDGSHVFMGPEESMAVQRALGSDIVMIFDECTPYPASEDEARRSMELSLRWAARSKQAHEGNKAALFAIVRAACTRRSACARRANSSPSASTATPSAACRWASRMPSAIACWISPCRNCRPTGRVT